MQALCRFFYFWCRMFTLPSVNAPAAFDWFCLPCFLKSFASSFQTFPRLVKVFVVDNTYGIFAILKTCLASSFCLRNLLSKLTFNPSWNFCPGVLVLVFPDVIFNRFVCSDKPVRTFRSCLWFTPNLRKY